MQKSMTDKTTAHSQTRSMLDDFQHKHGRPPRVLHIGNIANNAYLNAQILNDAGFDCDVICYDYYHIMGCPEWEDADFDGEIKDHFDPDWTSVDLRGFQRPHWFTQGPLEVCFAYLHARRTGDDDLSQKLRTVLRKASSAAGRPLSLWFRIGRKIATLGKRVRSIILYGISTRVLRAAYLLRVPQAYGYLRPFFQPSTGNSPNSSGGAHLALRAILLAPYAALVSLRTIWLWSQHFLSSTDSRSLGPGVPALADLKEQVYENLQSAFHKAFPAREDQLSHEDLTPYASVIHKWRELFKHYDVVIGYATDGLLPLLCNKRPYLAFEHGTIRNIPFEPTAQGRLCAATYRMADTSLITNCDNIKAAGELQLDNYRFVPHPVNERHGCSESADALRESVRQELDCDFIVFHPSRQHWEPRRHPDWEKGNDILIRGFADFINDAAPRAGAVFVDWGQKVDESRQLLEELGVAGRVKWIPPLPNRKMIDCIRASDVVADQFFLGAFGSLTPKGLLHECPVMLHLDEERHHWCFPEMPPVINVNTPESVCEGLMRLYRDQEYRQRLIADGLAWYRKYHSNEVIAATLASAIMQGIERRSVK